MAKGHTHSVQSVSVCGKIMVTGSSDRTIRVWDLSDNKEVLTVLHFHFHFRFSFPFSLSFSLDLTIPCLSSFHFHFLSLSHYFYFQFHFLSLFVTFILSYSTCLYLDNRKMF